MQKLYVIGRQTVLLFEAGRSPGSTEVHQYPGDPSVGQGNRLSAEDAHNLKVPRKPAGSDNDHPENVIRRTA